MLLLPNTPHAALCPGLLYLLLLPLPLLARRSRPRRKGEMILVATVVELLGLYTVQVARVLGQVLHGAPFPRRLRSFMLRSLPLTAVAAASAAVAS
ncbi:hypothetical protein Taro_031651 [Colocasia esculenta]|uniref:Uncharacterized protein n=1 Tax=Colocasia esculenta TaxID=4460 RepID=A0A843W1J3_COLES|nr:hypothetical protein [Colocasia esculenta]